MKRHPDDLRAVDFAWIVGPTPPLPTRLSDLDRCYVGFDGVKRMIGGGADDPLWSWADAGEPSTTLDRFNLVLSWPEDGGSLQPWIDRLGRALDHALGLEGRYGTPEGPDTPEDADEAADANTPAVSNRRPGNSGKRRRVDGKFDPLDPLTTRFEPDLTCAVKWCAKPRMTNHAFCNGPCRSASDLEVMRFHREYKREQTERELRLTALKERCKNVQARFQLRGIITEPTVTDDNQMALRLLSATAHTSYPGRCPEDVWTLTKCEQWLDEHPVKQ